MVFWIRQSTEAKAQSQEGIRHLFVVCVLVGVSRYHENTSHESFGVKKTCTIRWEMIKGCADWFL
jgi:hypothetical protein